MEEHAYLLLENGHIYEGKAFGARKTAVAELVFTTGMTGYIETLTDPSYAGQIVVQTFPLIGNYGMINDDKEADVPALSGYIVKNPADVPSNFRSQGTLEDWLIAKDIPGIKGIDTRSLTKEIRVQGVMRGMIAHSKELLDIELVRREDNERTVERVSCKEWIYYGPEGAPLTIVLWDFGCKGNIIKEVLLRGCRVILVPHSVSASEILAVAPDGILLSNGPGDPHQNADAASELEKLLASDIPIFGICMGHQVLALAAGHTTYKLKFGHRGANQPVKDLDSGRVYMTSQNHGYAVEISPDGLADSKVTFINVNDKTCEGLSYKNGLHRSVQFHPEGACGPKDTGYLFDQWIAFLKERKDAAKPVN
jgi:carbamoyl-phosphate synthase small subunit